MKSLFTLTGIALLCPLAFAAPAKAPAKKPAPKAPPKLIREVMGTQQLTGYEGKLGETFTVGKTIPVNFTLKKVTYSASRSNIGGYAQFPSGDEKLLILNFTIQNPRKTAFNYTTSYLSFKAVDASGITRNYVGDVAREVTGESMNITLQPGQKIEGYTAIKVAAYGEVPKLIVQSAYETTAPIVRYDLRGKAVKLAAPFADPADATGSTARKLVPAKMGVFYPVTDYFDVKIDSISYAPAIGNREAGDGKVYCFATATVQNKSPKTARFSASHFSAALKDVDGEKVSPGNSILKATRDEEASSELAVGETARFRFFWVLPEGVKAQSVLMQYGYDRESRTYAVEIPAETAE